MIFHTSLRIILCVLQSFEIYASFYTTDVPILQRDYRPSTFRFGRVFFYSSLNILIVITYIRFRPWQTAIVYFAYSHERFVRIILYVSDLNYYCTSSMTQILTPVIRRNANFHTLPPSCLATCVQHKIIKKKLQQNENAVSKYNH